MSLKPFAEAYMRVRPKSWMPSTVLLGTIWASPALTRPSGAARVRQAAILYELYRNGIIHGTLLNYDNDVVATKAWNRLFAVVDWAKARTKEQQPPRAEPTWWEVFAQLADNARKERAAKECDRTPVVGPSAMRVRDGWRPRPWRSRSGSDSPRRCGVGRCCTRSASPGPVLGPRGAW
jgi:hypothetical protein